MEREGETIVGELQSDIVVVDIREESGLSISHG
jgi:hypothetical protein